MLSPSTSAEEKIKLTWLVCDLDAAGGVTLANLTRVLQMARAGMHPAEGDAGAAPEGGEGGGEPASPQTPFLARRESYQQREFAKFDVDGDRKLDYAEFAAFVHAHKEVLELGSELIKERLASADLLSNLTATVAKIKRERSVKAVEAQGAGTA